MINFHCKENFELTDEMERCVTLEKHDKKDINGQLGSNKLKDVDDIQSSIGSENLKLIKRLIREAKVKLHDIRAMAIKMQGNG